MVDNQEQKRRVLCRRDHSEIRYLRFCGLTARAIALHLGASYEAVRHRVNYYKLDRPVSEAEAVVMALEVSYRDTAARLRADDLSSADHGRLCATQVKLASALLRAMPGDFDTKEDNMSRKSDAERKRILDMSDEEAFDELRQMAGLERKSIAIEDKRDAPKRGKSFVDERVYPESDGGPEATDTE